MTEKTRGRPKKIIDYELVKNLASICCTEEEIATIMDVSVRTLQRDSEFCRIYKKGLEDGKSSLRRTQFKLSQTNPTMAIWLGKQYLGQTDKVQTELKGQLSIEDYLKDHKPKL